MSKKKKRVARDQTSERIKLDESHADIMNLALDQCPELRICAGAVKAARENKVDYPIKSCKEIVKIMPQKELDIEGHCIRPGHIKRYMPKEYFPINDERELITRCFIALMRCKDDVSWAVRAPSYASKLLKEVAAISCQKGAK